MASFEKVYYCKNCKKNVTVDDKLHCKKCGGSSLNVSWSVRFRLIENGIEKQKRLSGYETKKKANDDYLKFISTHNSSTSQQNNFELKFSDLFEEYKNFAKSQNKASSYYDFCSKCNKHIYPYFKDFLVKEISPKVILAWQNKLQKYAFKYKSNLRGYLNSILNYAQKYYKIENQLKNVDNFKKTINTKEMQIWTPEEFNKFIAEVENPIYHAFFMALYYTGARKGELLATNWNDWDLKTGILNINKSLTKKVFEASWLITSPKNQSSVRKVSLPKILINELTNFKQGNEDNAFVFYGDKPLADSNVERVQKQACEKANVKKIRIHDFRHSHASLLISQNISIVAVSKRLGHANTQQTLNTYAHLMPAEETMVLNVLEKASKI